MQHYQNKNQLSITLNYTSATIKRSKSYKIFSYIIQFLKLEYVTEM